MQQIITTDHNGPQRTQNLDERDQYRSQEEDKSQNNTKELLTMGVGGGDKRIFDFFRNFIFR